MEQLILKQPFYPHLNNDTKKLLLSLNKAYKKKKLINNISIYIYLLIGIIFLISFKMIIFEKIYIENINSIFSILKLFVIIGGLFSITEVLIKDSKKNCDKSLQKLKSYMVMDICNCEHKCCCKTELIKFLSSQGIYLL